MTATRANPRQHAKLELMAAYRVQMNRAYRLNRASLITLKPLPTYSAAALRAMTERLRGRLDSIEKEQTL